MLLLLGINVKDFSGLPEVFILVELSTTAFCFCGRKDKKGKDWEMGRMPK